MVPVIHAAAVTDDQKVKTGQLYTFNVFTAASVRVSCALRVGSVSCTVTLRVGQLCIEGHAVSCTVTLRVGQLCIEGHAVSCTVTLRVGQLCIEGHAVSCTVTLRVGQLCIEGHAVSCTVTLRVGQLCIEGRVGQLYCNTEGGSAVH